MKERCVVSLLVMGALLGWSGGAGAQPPSHYDQFTASVINPEKWLGLESGPHDNEVVRGILGGQAQLLLRTTGSRASNSGFMNASNRLRISHKALLGGTPRITMMEGRVTVVSAEVGTCAANPLASHARAQVISAFFNDGTGNNKAGDRTGDVFAGVQKTKSSAGGNHLDAFVLRCTDPGCNTTASVVTAGGTFARSWAVGQADLMRIRWNSAANNFAFTVGSETVTLSYTVPDAALPKRLFNDFSDSFALANCTAGAVSAFLDTRIDDVRLNSSAMTAALP